MTIQKDQPLELIGTELTRRSFLGWTAKIGLVAVTTKIIPVSLDDLEEWKSNGITITDEALIRSQLWSKELKRILYEDFQEFFNFMGDVDYEQSMHDEWQRKSD